MNDRKGPLKDKEGDKMAGKGRKNRKEGKGRS